jgi:drug/metabolite transporter (DMT)-like permease
VFSVIVGSQAVGGPILLGFVLLWGEPIPTLRPLALGGLGGICGALGLVALYRGMATKPMGVVAPVSAVVTGVPPIIVGIWQEGFPPIQQFTGFGVALVAVWLLSQEGEHARIRLDDLALPASAGFGFGLFFIFIDQVSGESVVWPLIAARFSSVTLFLAIMGLRRQPLALTGKLVPTIILAGLFDSAGNVFFALATRTGRLDLAAVLGSLYPAGTVFLAWWILEEKLSRPQWFGVATALAALVLIAL